ncbi:MAG: glutathione S-transferase family protein [Myxococcales bacterium]|nr:glutathione S-transferase family protein [Myxococcales bacterium]
MKLYGNPLSNNCRKVYALIEHLGVDVELVAIDMMKREMNGPEFRKINPNGKVPAFTDGDLVLFESNAIMLYLAEKFGTALWPADATVRAEAAKWMFWEVGTLTPVTAAVVMEQLLKPMLGGTTDPAEVVARTERYKPVAAILDAHLAHRRYLTGDQPTIADLSLGSAMTYAPFAGLFEGFPHIAAWYRRLDEIDGWKQSAPPVGRG